jgi:hypothetical protein
LAASCVSGKGCILSHDPLRLLWCCWQGLVWLSLNVNRLTVTARRDLQHDSARATVTAHQPGRCVGCTLVGSLVCFWAFGGPQCPCT